MALRFYVVPKVGTGASMEDPLRPKYIPELGQLWSAMDYGKEGTMLAAADVTSAQHTALAANADVTAIPAALDSTVTNGALTTIRAQLEALKIPAGWVTTAHTYRQVVGAVGRIFMLMQRFDGMFRRVFFETGIQLDTRMNQLTAGQRQALQQAADSFGLNSSTVTGATTVRQVLKIWIDQMGPFTLHGETF